jgi:hypothetical protein
MEADHASANHPPHSRPLCHGPGFCNHHNRAIAGENRGPYSQSERHLARRATDRLFQGQAFNKLFVVTLDQPHHRQPCSTLSFTIDKLVCSRVLGEPRTYLPQQVLALIVPGDGRAKLWFVLGINGGMGTAIWGTVVLAAACPACAVATGVAAFLLFVVAAGVLAADDQPDRLLYGAPGQKLSRKLGYVQYREP